MIIPGTFVMGHPRICRVLEKGHFLNRIGNVVTMNTGTTIAAIAVLLTVLGGVYGLTIVPMQEDIDALKKLDHEEFVDHEIRIRAVEISDSRTGARLESLTESINRLIKEMETRFYEN